MPVVPRFHKADDDDGSLLQAQMWKANIRPATGIEDLGPEPRAA
jgi:hypothetical protein